VSRIEKLSIDKKAYRDGGSAIHGEKILAQARKIIKKGQTSGSSKDQIQRCDLQTNAYCIIAKPLRSLKAPKK